jgi:hypothetical protein
MGDVMVGDGTGGKEAHSETIPKIELKLLENGYGYFSLHLGVSRLESSLSQGFQSLHHIEISVSPDLNKEFRDKLYLYSH